MPLIGIFVHTVPAVLQKGIHLQRLEAILNSNLGSRFQSLSETEMIKNCRLSSWFKKTSILIYKTYLLIHDKKHVGIEIKFYNLYTFKKQVDANCIDLNSEFVDLNYIVASLIFCHFRRSIYRWIEIGQPYKGLFYELWVAQGVWYGTYSLSSLSETGGDYPTPVRDGLEGLTFYRSH